MFVINPQSGVGPPVPVGWAVIPQPSPLAPAAIRLTPDRQAVAFAFAFVPAEQYAGYLSPVPQQVEQFTEGHRAYRVALQQHIGEFLRLIRAGGVDPQPYIVAIRMVAFTLWCARTGQDALDPIAPAAYPATCADNPAHADVTAVAASPRCSTKESGDMPVEIVGHNGDGSPWGRDMTGRYLVVLDESNLDAEMGTLDQALDSTMARGSEFHATADPAEMPGSIVFERLGVAVVDVEPERMEAFAATTGPRRIVEPERYVYALPALILAEAPAATWDPKASTWGLQATGVVNSPFSGNGVKVAILDTGFDLHHPDFADRTIVSESFIAGEAVQDGNGHGTHCVGTSCGPRTSAGAVPRYGVAHNAEIYVGKVLSNAGSGSDAGILAGIDWAIRNGCRVVSMSLGAPASGPSDPYSQVYETVARRAAAQGTLIIAAAGNENGTVGHPANCPSIMAVGALDSTLLRAGFSNSSGNLDGAQVDIAAPGVDVWSSWPMPKRYRSISGTSMATPHVAGIVALLAEAEPTATPMALWGRLAAQSRRLPLPSTQIGAGLAQAPQ